MLRPQIDTYDMFLSVENKFNDDLAIWSENVPVLETFTAFKNDLDELAVNVGIQLQSHTGITADKDRIRHNLQSQAFTIAAATYAYAVTYNKGNLARHTYYPISTLERYRDAELHSVCTHLYKDCKNEGAALEPYGIQSTTLDQFATTCENFFDIMKNPQDAIAIKKEATHKIAVLLPKITELLKTRMDNLMIAFKNVHPEFVSVYFNLRAIKTTGGRHLSLTVSTLDAVTKAPIFKAKLEIIGENIKRTSSARGYNKVAHLAEGRHEISITHPNYSPKKMFFTVIAGETTELVALLESL